MHSKESFMIFGMENYPPTPPPPWNFSKNSSEITHTHKWIFKVTRLQRFQGCTGVYQSIFRHSKVSRLQRLRRLRKAYVEFVYRYHLSYKVAEDPMLLNFFYLSQRLQGYRSYKVAQQGYIIQPLKVTRLQRLRRLRRASLKDSYWYHQSYKVTEVTIL